MQKDFIAVMRKENKPSLKMRGERELLLGIWDHLDDKQRLKVLVALLLMLVSGLAEVVSLAAVVPFLGVISNPNQLWEIQIIQTIARSLSLREPTELLIPITVLFGTAALIAGSIRLLNLWVNGRLAAAIGSDLSCESYKRTLYQPYAVHVRRNSSEVITKVTTQTQQVVIVLNAFLQLVTATVVAASLITTLLLIDWQVACTAISVFGTAYVLLSLTAKRKLEIISRQIADASELQLRVLQEGLGAIRDVLLDSNQETYLSSYRRADIPMRLRQAQSTFLGSCPRYGLEALGLVLIAIMTLFLNTQRGETTTVIPILGTLALGSQRLLPALQQIYGNWALMKSRQSALEDVLTMLDQKMPRTSIVEEALPLNHTLNIKDVSFKYMPESEYVLRGICLEIKRGERIGVIGSTGSGKSTLVDLIMGLLEPTEGKIEVDGIDLHAPNAQIGIDNWRATIAHVPQTIFLSDSTITENIAFGIPWKQIDHEKVRKAAKHAQISGFIESLPDGFAASVGERGISLSGGQRQRIGIARALYKHASVMVFDEATSALDNETEAAVMSALDRRTKDLTVIMIAHRLSTLKYCDRIIKLENGRVTETTLKQGI